MLAYTNTVYTKDAAVALAQSHQDADRFVQGTYWDVDDQRGCSVGCMVKDIPGVISHKNWHEAAGDGFGIPKHLAYLQDRMFEGLPLKQAKLWTVRFMAAIPDGADLSLVHSHFLHWLMTDSEGPRKHARPDGLIAIDKVASLYERRLNGDEPSATEWGAAASAASAADAAASAASAADAAADAAAYAAADAADAAAYAAADAADAADAAAYAAADAAYRRMSDKLIEFIEQAPVPVQSPTNPTEAATV